MKVQDEKKADIRKYAESHDLYKAIKYANKKWGYSWAAAARVVRELTCATTTQ